MNEETARGRQLGRGLSALFGEDPPPLGAPDGRPHTLPVELLKPSPYQPRRDFDDEHLASLVDSVRDRGILQPLIVRRDPAGDERYEIVAGERRWRAAQRAQLHMVPVVVQDLSDEAALEVALIENIQRQDLAPLEEAEGYRRLMGEFAHTQEELARVVGKSRSHVANMLRLLQLSDGVRALLVKGDLSAGHARALLNADNPDRLAKRVVRRGLNVRQTEKLVQKAREGAGEGPGKGVARAGAAAVRDPDIESLERDLTTMLGLKVAINFRADGGELVVHYRTLDQLHDVLRRLGTTGAPPGA